MYMPLLIDTRQLVCNCDRAGKIFLFIIKLYVGLLHKLFMHTGLVYKLIIELMSSIVVIAKTSVEVSHSLSIALLVIES